MQTNIRKKLEFSHQGDHEQSSSSIEETSTDTLEVYLRLRPISETEKSKGVMPCIIPLNSKVVSVEPLENSRAMVQHGPRSTYTFTEVFNEKTTQGSFFDATASSSVLSFLRGEDSIIFAYGMSNAGKTYTIQGASDSDDQKGILPRALDLLFRSIQQSKERARSNFLGESDLGDVPTLESGMTYRVYLSYFEVYNEKILDLLDNSNTNDRQPLLVTPVKGSKLQLAEDFSGRSVVNGLCQVHVSCLEAAYAVLERGQNNRSVAATALNEASSRSHSVFSIVLMRTPEGVDSNAIKANPRSMIKYSRLSVVDLAGAERNSRTGAEGARLQESSNINKSLLTFKRCLETLRWNQTQVSKERQDKIRMIPYRDSILTKFIRGFYFGTAKGVMIVNASVGDNDLEETIHCVKFAALASEITTSTRIDTGLGPRRALKSRYGASESSSSSSSSSTTVEIERLQAELRALQETCQDNQQNALLSEMQLRSEASEFVLQQLQLREEELERRYRRKIEDMEAKYERKLAIIENMFRNANPTSSSSSSSSSSESGHNDLSSFKDVIQLNELKLKHTKVCNELQALQQTLEALKQQQSQWQSTWSAEKESLLAQFQSERVEMREQFEEEKQLLHRQFEEEKVSLVKRYEEECLTHHQTISELTAKLLDAKGRAEALTEMNTRMGQPSTEGRAKRTERPEASSSVPSGSQSPTPSKTQRPKTIATPGFLERLLTPDRRPRPKTINTCSPAPVVVISPPSNRSQVSYIAVSPAAVEETPAQSKRPVRKSTRNAAPAAPVEVAPVEPTPSTRTSPKRTRAQKTLGDRMKSPFAKKKRGLKESEPSGKDALKLNHLQFEIQDSVSSPLKGDDQIENEGHLSKKPLKKNQPSLVTPSPMIKRLRSRK